MVVLTTKTQIYNKEKWFYKKKILDMLNIFYILSERSLFFQREGGRAPHPPDSGHFLTPSLVLKSERI